MISLCDGTLNKLQDEHLSMLELKVVLRLKEAITMWEVERSNKVDGRVALQSYFNEGEGPLVRIEQAYELSSRLEERGDVDNIFQLTASVLWRYHWLHSKAHMIAALYMDITRLFSLPRGTILGIYTFVIHMSRRKNSAELKRLKEGGFLSAMRWLRPRKQGREM
jgi:hypothetical protein